MRLRPGSILMYGIAESVSAFFLLLVIVVHYLFPKLNCQATSLMCHTISLLMLFVTYPLRQFIEYDTIGNVIIFAIHYTFGLAAFFWLNVFGFDLWRLFAKMPGIHQSPRPRNTRKLIYTSIYAWGIPTAMCAFCITLGFNPEIQQKTGVVIHFSTYNWFENERSALPFFYAPVSIAVVMNVILFILTVINVRRASRGTEIVNMNANKKYFRLCIKLFLVMGMCWLVEILTFIPKVLGVHVDESAYYFPDLISCFQGLYIFMVYVFKRKTYHMFRDKLKMKRMSSVSSVTTLKTLAGSSKSNSSINELSKQ